MLYKKKRHLLNAHILHLTFSLVGTVDSGRESSVIPNKAAFKDLLCDLEVRIQDPSYLHLYFSLTFGILEILYLQSHGHSVVFIYDCCKTCIQSKYS